MKTKHTPGPWEIETVPIESRGGSDTCHKIGPFNACIYDDWVPREKGISEEENNANAKLIAAAPELLEALNDFYTLIDSGDLVRDISKDNDFTYFTRQGIRITNAIVSMNEAIKKATI